MNSYGLALLMLWSAIFTSLRQKSSNHIDSTCSTAPSTASGCRWLERMAASTWNHSTTVTIWIDSLCRFICLPILTFSSNFSILRLKFIAGEFHYFLAKALTAARISAGVACKSTTPSGDIRIAPASIHKEIVLQTYDGMGTLHF